MKHLPVLCTMVLGIALTVAPVQAEDLPAVIGSENIDSAVGEELGSEGNIDEEVPRLEEGEEGEVTERGVHRFKLKPRPRINIQKKPPSRITIPHTPRRTIPIPQTKNPPPSSPTEGTKNPLVEDEGGQKQSVVIPPGSQCVVTTSDIVLDQQIDIGDNDGAGESAKQSLLRMLSYGNEEQRRAASGMVQAIKAQSLAGIYQWNKQAVSIRSQTLTPPRGPWDLIPKGQLSTCLKEPIGELPMIIYSRQPMHPSVLDHALVTAWGQCGLPTPNPPCEYIRDMGNKPQPPITPTGAGLTVFALENNNPLLHVVVTVVGPDSPPKKFTDSDGAADFDALEPGFYTVTADGCGIGYSVGSRTVELGDGEQTSLPIPLTKGCTGERADCPPGTIPDPSGALCILPNPPTRSCTNAEMVQEFQKQTNFCASIKSGIDLNCSLGASPCDLLPAAKLLCDLFEKGTGKSTKHPACDVPRATFYEQCVVSTVIGERPGMACHPGSNGEILQQYRSWPDREK